MKIILITKNIINKIFWVLDSVLWIFKFKRKEIKLNNPSLTIGVTTFMNRFHSCLIPLVNKLTKLFPETEIIIVANGHILKEEQKEYLKEISKFCSSFNNIKLIKHKTPIGLSKIWNQIVKVSSNENILILNDDVDIQVEFIYKIRQALLIHNKLTTINNSWSHFLISKSLTKEIGGFDEGLKEIGGEDDDYCARMALNKIVINRFETNTIKGKLKLKQKRLNVNSYGKDMNKEENGYSSFNNKYLEKKWKMSNVDFEGAIEVPNRMNRYWKLR